MSVGFGIGRIARSFPPRRFQELHDVIISIPLDAYMQCIYTMIVDITLTLRGQSFEWDAEKAASNFAKHGVAFPEACEVFFDPFFHLVDASRRRSAGSGYRLYGECAPSVCGASDACGGNHPNHFCTARYTGREEIL